MAIRKCNTVTMFIDVRHLYKEETGCIPIDEEELEFYCWRSKGQWVIDISDTERLGLFGRESQITFTRPDPDYVEWLENKITELLTHKY
jgi:hypothetical protein